MSKGSTYFFTAWSAVMFALAVAALFMSGCASVPAKPIESPVVAGVIFLDRCDGSLVEAAFFHSDGTITETADEQLVKQLSSVIKADGKHGLAAPVYAGECSQKL